MRRMRATTTSLPARQLVRPLCLPQTLFVRAFTPTRKHLALATVAFLPLCLRPIRTGGGPPLDSPLLIRHRFVFSRIKTPASGRMPLLNPFSQRHRRNRTNPIRKQIFTSTAPETSTQFSTPIGNQALIFPISSCSLIRAGTISAIALSEISARPPINELLQQAGGTRSLGCVFTLESPVAELGRSTA
jgi:hypothetical protein